MVTRLSGGLTPADGSDPRTFPAIWNVTADEIEAQGTAISGAESDIDTLEGKNIPAFGTAVPSDGQVLTFDSAGSEFVPEDVATTLADLTDTDISSPSSGEVLEYDGTNWVNSAAAGGGLVAVKSALKTDAESFTSVAAGGNVAVPDLSITHEVSDPANKLIITAVFGAAGGSQGGARVGIAVHDGSGLIAVGDSAGSRTSLSAGGQISSTGVSGATAMPSVTFVHTPGSGSKTYNVRAISLVPQTVYINRNGNDNDSADRPRAVSSLVIQEVAV